MSRLLIVLAALLVGCATISPAETGETCVEDHDCVDGRCVEARDDMRLRYCTEVCDGDGYCPVPMHCIESTCRYPIPSPGALGSSCAAATQCVDQLCRDEMCTMDCAAQGICPGGYQCRTDATGSFCAAPEPAGDGCAAAGGSGSPSLLVLLAWIAVAFRLRISRRPV